MFIISRFTDSHCIVAAMALVLCSCSSGNDPSVTGKPESISQLESATALPDTSGEVSEATGQTSVPTEPLSTVSTPAIEPTNNEAAGSSETTDGSSSSAESTTITPDNTIDDSEPELGAARPDDCVAYSESNHYKPRSTTTILYPDSDWISQIEGAVTDTEFLLEDGDYLLTQYAVVVKEGLTIRSLNGNRDNVRIIGPGYAQGAEGLMVVGNDVTIADLSISDLRDHAIAVKPELGAMRDLQIYNLSIKDTGTQHIKVSPGGARNGLVACSSIGYSVGAAIGDYNGAIDLHDTIDWELRDNFIYNITGDGSGCRVDTDCGTYLSAPAIYAWNGAQGTRIIRNTVLDSFRNIALGMGTEHNGGVISHNTITQSSPGDAGIELFGASDVVVEGNTVLLSGSYPGAIEYRNSSNLSIFNNTLSSAPWDRGGNSNIELFNNATDL